MIPIFPEFKKLELSDQQDVESVTVKYPPYSDFNFISMWCWDTEGKVRISNLHGNLVIRFADYISGEPFYSFIGEHKIDDTAKTLLELSTKENIPPTLRLVPEIVAMQLNPQSFHVEENRNDFDYVLSVESLTTYSGSQLMSKRNYVNRFKKNYRYEDRIIYPLNKESKKELLKLFERWADVKGYSDQETKHELNAFSRFLNSSENLDNFAVFGVYIEKELVGFWVVEVTSKNYAVSHFEKADISVYKGIYSYLKQGMAIFLLEKGIDFINLEQDLGIPGLRKGKMDYHPCSYLRKYSVQLV